MYLQSSELCKFQRRLHDSRIRFLSCHDKWWLFCYCLIKAKFISPWANDFATIISTIETWSYLSTACACLPTYLPACAPFYWIRLVIQGVWKKIVLVICTLWSYSFIIIRLAEIFIYFLNWINDLVNTLKGNPLEWNQNHLVQFLVKDSMFPNLWVVYLMMTSLWKCLLSSL